VDCYNWTETPEEFLILMEFVAQPECFSLHLEELNLFACSLGETSVD
jgi:hypothetical protein